MLARAYVEHLHKSVDVTLPMLNAWVAAGGMICDSVLDGATEAALEVLMVCAFVRAARAQANTAFLNNILLHRATAKD